MKPEELNEYRLRLGLSIDQMWQVLGTTRSTYTGWFTRGKVPAWAGYSAENLELLPKRTLSKLLSQRER